MKIDNEFNISICTGISNVMTLETDIEITNYTFHCQTVHIKNYEYNRPIWFNIIITPSNNNDTQQGSNYTLNPYKLSIPKNLTDTTEDIFYSNTLNSNYFLLNLGQASLITFKPMIKFDTYENNVKFTYTVKLELMPRLEQIPKRLKPNELQIGFNFPSTILKFEESAYKSTDLIADLGGFYNAIAGKYIITCRSKKKLPPIRYICRPSTC
ncbi:3833_t:CDS:2 [Funneliformis caledonium]|uniref:3833_t:CDS:1 n=1 Tax=Funneliformis caledonium TaxID=1117310 RepID=A0A9N8VSC8_9GLOM|nr:3833_t:CDS:2 [Funneliformis caledonium]